MNLKQIFIGFEDTNSKFKIFFSAKRENCTREKALQFK